LPSAKITLVQLTAQNRLVRVSSRSWYEAIIEAIYVEEESKKYSTTLEIFKNSSITAKFLDRLLRPKDFKSFHRSRRFYNTELSSLHGSSGRLWTNRAM